MSAGRAVLFSQRGYGIQSSATERMTAQKAPDREAGAPQRSMSCNRDGGVFRTRGQKPASATAQRVHRRRDPSLIEREQTQKDARHRASSALAIGGASIVLARARSALAC